MYLAFNNVATNDPSMRCSRLNVINSNKPLSDLINRGQDLETFCFKFWFSHIGTSVVANPYIIKLQNCFRLLFIHLKLELLTQFPALNDEKLLYL